MKKPALLVVIIGVVIALFGCQQPTDPQPQSHTITFNANGGTGTMLPQTIVSGATAVLSANTFTRAGLSFAGWAASASGSAAYVNGASYTMGTADVTLFAVWTTNPSYTVTFNANGGMGTMTAQSIVSGLSAALTANAFTKAGFSFAGWATSASGSVAYANGANYTIGSADVTLYAVWTNSPSYTITFNANGGTGSMTALSIVSGLSANLTANTFTRAGMCFTGWATSASGSVSYSDGASYIMGTADVTLYAIWSTSPSYTITFNANGGTGTMSAQSIVSGVSANLHANSFTRAGYSFTGWATSASGSVSYSDGASYIMGTADVTLYAIWSTSPSYTITFNANGGTGTMSAQAIVSGVSANLHANSFTRAGYSFEGWATSASGSVSYADGASYTMGSANVTLYAKWTINPSYTITFNANSGTGTMTTQSIVSGLSANLTVNSFTRAGYSFAGWATGASDPVAYADGASYSMGSAGVTLYAKWTINPSYAITFHANGGSGSMTAQSIVSGLSANLTFNSFTRAGYSFAGWSTSASGSVEYMDGASYPMGSANATLYAKWTINSSYTITFNTNGGTGSMSSQSIVSGLSANLTANSFTRTNYTFAGWSSSASGSVEYADGASYTMGSADVTLYAKWTVNSYTITFNANGSTGTMTSQSIASGSSANLTANSFTRSGYVFNGWATTSSAGVGEYMDMAAYLMGTENVTFYAIWEPGSPGLAYTLINGDTEYSVSHGTVTTGNLIIPAYYNTKRVTAINSSAFASCSGLTGNLTIPIGITSIGSNAFYGCSGLNGTLTIPSSVTSIGSSAFYGCSGLNGTLTIPSNVTSIGSSTFYGCSGFTGTLTIPSNVTAIGDNAFRGCTGFTGNLTIPSSVISIGSYTFYHCTGFSGNLTIPTSVASIGPYAFWYCSGLIGSLTIPSSITSIGESAFHGCSKLTGSLTIPNNVTSIGGWAFAGCSGFTGSLTIPSSVASIGLYAFWGCTGFTGNLTIPNGVISIGSYAFSGCVGFTGSLTIPSSVTAIGSYAFQNCSGFTGSLTIPSGVTSIGSNTFYGCSGFTGTLTIPDSVTSIEDSAFQNCSGFTGSLTIPSGVTFIRSSAFSGCLGFTNTLTIPSSVTSIGSSAFYGCSGLTTALVNATTPPYLQNDVLFTFDYRYITSIAVPSGSVDTYKTTPNWSSYAAKIVSQ